MNKTLLPQLFQMLWEKLVIRATFIFINMEYFRVSNENEQISNRNLFDVSLLITKDYLHF